MQILREKVPIGLGCVKNKKNKPQSALAARWNQGNLPDVINCNSRNISNADLPTQYGN